VKRKYDDGNGEEEEEKEEGMEDEEHGVLCTNEMKSMVFCVPTR